VAAKRKVSKKPAAKKSAAKPGAPRAKRASEQERETHYSDLRKVMLASVLKRLR
jgi:hypothetical protein